VPGHEVLRLLAMPGAELSGLAALRLLQSHLDLAGECFLQLRREGGRVVGFSVIPPNAIIALPTTDAPVYEVSYGAVQRGMVPASEVVHVKHPSPYDPSARGVGLGHTLGDELQVNEFVSESLRSVFARGGMPTTLVSVAGADQNQDSQDIAEDLQKRFGGEIVGPTQQGKILVLPGKITSTVVNADLKQLAVVEIQKYVQDFVRQVFAVPPEILGDLSSSNRSTSEAAEYHLQAYAVLPRLEFLVAELNHKLVPLIDSSVVLDFDDPRPSSLDICVNLMTNGNTAHAFTQNEVRALAGLGPTEGGDENLLPPPGSKPVGGAP
jgi:HK97 family phage portal protein